MFKLIGENIQFVSVGIFLLALITFVMMIAKSKKLQEILQDGTSKTLSSARLMCLLLVISYVFYAGYIVLTKGIIPDLPTTVFGLVSLLYGVNKIGPNISVGGGGQNSASSSKP